MKPWLLLPAQLAHDLSPVGLQLYSLFHKSPTPVWKSFVWKNILFKNRLGLAGGVDKNGDLLNVWQPLGCGFIEIGTVVPEPQKSNTGKILDRSLTDLALWNQMGFPSAGSEEVFFNLRNYKESKEHLPLPVLVNIGKNRTTANESAHADYLVLLNKFYHLADAFVINISSPNTNGLRELVKPENLKFFLQPLLAGREELASVGGAKKPFLLKLSPDIEPEDLKGIIDTCVEMNIDGYVLTNTTLNRNTQKTFPSHGGVSGKPLQDLSKKSLQIVCSHLGGNKSKNLIISVGGVMTAEDVFERIEMGADLVEVYSALIFEGPSFFREVSRKFYGKNGK